MSIVNEIADLFKQLKSIAKFAKDTSTMSILVELQEKFIELREENADLREKLKDKENIEEIEKRIVRNNGDAADYTDENGHTYCICTNCWDNNKKIIQVSKEGSGTFYCGVCKAYKEKRK